MLANLLRWYSDSSMTSSRLRACMSRHLSKGLGSRVRRPFVGVGASDIRVMAPTITGNSH